MAAHVKILAILHIIFGAIGVGAAILVLFVFGGVSALVGLSDHTGEGWTAIPVLGAIAGFIFIVVMVLSLPSLVVGIGLMQFRPWGRIGGIILSALHLLNVPFGTALGIYGFWILLNPETEQLFLSGTARLAPGRY